MLSAFQSNLATFNAVVSSGNIASDPIARPPKVTETGLRQFYRIKKHASPDTDGDGIHDSRELMDTGTSPFSKNSDGDLYDDGDELLMGFSPLNPADLADNDADRIPNYLDVHPSNALLDWEKVDDTLYSWTPLFLPAAAAISLGIGNNDAIYFTNGVILPSGAWQPLIRNMTSPQQITDAIASHFNDAGQIVGTARVKWSSGFQTESAAVYWSSPSATPAIIGRGQGLVHHWYGVPVIANDGTIHVSGVRDWAPGGQFYTTANTSTAQATNQFSYNYFLPFSGGPLKTRQTAAIAHRQLGAGARYYVNPNLTTRQDLQAYQNGLYTTLATNIPSYFSVNEVEVLPNGRGMVAGSAGTWGNACFFARPDGSWAQTTSIFFASAANKRGEFLQGTSIWRNGESRSLISLSPQVAALGRLNISGQGINDSGTIFASAYNIGQAVPSIYGLLRPAEFGIDLIYRDELAGNFTLGTGLIEQARPIPSVSLNVTGTRVLSSGNVEIDISCTVRDPISELISNPALRLQELNLYLDGELVESVTNLPERVSGGGTLSVWQPAASQVTIQRTFIIHSARTGAVNIRAETGVNPAGNQGWDIASVLLTRAGADEVEGTAGTNFAIRLLGTSSSSVDIIYGRFGTGVEAVLSETSSTSLEFTGTVIDAASSKPVRVILNPQTKLTSSVDQVHGWLQSTSAGATSEVLLRWQETDASTGVFTPAAKTGIENSGIMAQAPLRVAHVAKGTRSLEGSVKPFVIRLAFPSNTLSQIGDAYRFEINNVSYPVVVNNSLIPGESPPTGMSWAYAAEGGIPKLFSASPNQSGTLAPVNLFQRSTLSAILWNKAIGQPVANSRWALLKEPATFPPSPPPLDGGGPSIAARSTGNYTQRQVFEYYDLIFMEYGKILKESMEGRGLKIQMTNVWDIDARDWIRKNFTPRDKQLGLRPELWIDHELKDVSRATVAMFEGLYSLKKWYVRDDLRLAVFDNVLNDAIASDGNFELVYRELHEARLGAIGDALEAFSTAAIIGLTIINEPLDYVMSFSLAVEHYREGEIVQGSATAALAVIPFVCGRLSAAGKVLRVDLPGNPFSILPDAQAALAQTVLKDVTRVERMSTLAPFIRDGTISANLVDALYRGGFLKYKNNASAVLRTNLEAQLSVTKKWREVAHHDLPVGFDLQFLRAGIDINQGAATGRFLPADFHKKLHSGSGWGRVRGSPWNHQWDKFFAANLNATAEQIMEFRDFM